MLQVINPGFNTTLQDAGRKGFRHLGIANDGPMDSLHFCYANILAGNQEQNTAIEILAGTFSVRANCDLLIAVAGQGFQLSSEHKQTSRKLPLNWQIRLRENEVLTVKQDHAEAICYLAIAGGFEADTFLGSQSTNPPLQRGGLCGRSLQRGDLIESRGKSDARKPGQALRGVKTEKSDAILRALSGPEYDVLPNRLRESFWSNRWQVENQRNKMGVRISYDNGEAGRAPDAVPENNLKSHAVLPGTVQLTAATNAIILGPGCQTTGGYFRIAKVIEADLWKKAHLASGSSFQFQLVNEKIAFNALKQRQQSLYKFLMTANNPPGFM